MMDNQNISENNFETDRASTHTTAGRTISGTAELAAASAKKNQGFPSESSILELIDARIVSSFEDLHSKMTTNEEGAGKKSADERGQIIDRTTDMKLDEESYEALKLISTLGSGVGFDKILNGNKLTANIEHLRTKKNMLLFEQLSKTRDELEVFSDKVDQMERHVLDLKTAFKTSN